MAAAAAAGSLECIRQLIASGSDVSQVGRYRQDALDKVLLLDEGATEMVRELLSAWAKRPDGKERANQALRECMSDEDKRLDVVQEVLKWADASARGPSRTGKDDPGGASALDLAAIWGRGAGVVESLIEAGADANATNAKGMSAINMLIFNPFVAKSHLSGF